MNGIKRAQDLGTLMNIDQEKWQLWVEGGPEKNISSILNPAYCQEVAEHIANHRHRFERETPMKLRQLAVGLRQLADAVDEQAVLVAETLAEIECAEPGTEMTKDIVLYVPGELKEALTTFLEVGLASVTAHLEELEEDELQLVELLQNTIVDLECAEPTPEEVLSRNRTLLRGDSVDIEGL